MIVNIAEDVARERGHMEVNVELFEKVEALGDLQEQIGLPSEWTEEALALLQQKIETFSSDGEGICGGYVET